MDGIVSDEQVSRKVISESQVPKRFRNIAEFAEIEQSGRSPREVYIEKYLEKKFGINGCTVDEEEADKISLKMAQYFFKKDGTLEKLFKEVQEAIHKKVDDPFAGVEVIELILRLSLARKEDYD